MSLKPQKEGDLSAALKTIDDILAHFQVVGDLAREARSRLTTLQEQAPAERAERRVARQEPTSSSSAAAGVPDVHEVPNVPNVTAVSNLASLSNVVYPELRSARSSIRLTPRQRQVLELLVQGASNRRISRTLHIAEQTVKAHLHMVYRKLGVADRTEAVVTAIRASLVPEHLLSDQPPPPCREVAS
ncbi:regulatory protein, luxR family [Streptoalloteichus tenebrarius]|uniref:Regulatory protein, luxR family n=1 Tax=Streptoalloteichus tenebrarius (strain ATCC 17920 / DSM 40477 / JCM 4838 / CBS 697.72 / NBRC 16177 / NCIMB 11028 / NRRL B-12390 / A12253. 1 / ISP 5477) TaxID=1933 RepID=A0ABT1HLH5_STRSD|nr:response regulator transcription factor [Streptoalloteichus tenebrarius]MCP2256360.1 regulatory protein, luxR family [Streptoalloteichus tenebrarius]BFF04700.1 hypothetical protein GCM10020241_63750 [Streptoalloteichus tenebrarius]